jgi:hypothetical protein
MVMFMEITHTCSDIKVNKLPIQNRHRAASAQAKAGYLHDPAAVGQRYILKLFLAPSMDWVMYNHILEACSITLV